MQTLTPYFDRDGVTIYNGDCLTVLQSLPAESVNCCVTSPPYWGLRDYGTATWDGGDPACDHKLQMDWVSREGGLQRETIVKQNEAKARRRSGDNCEKCGAVRVDNQIGLESTPEEYVSKLVKVFAAVRHMLKDDGTLWLNLGDSYATGAGKVGDCPGGGEQGERWKQRQDFYSGNRGSRGGSKKQPHTGASVGPITQPNRLPIPGLKPKDLVGIPWRVAFALQQDGWYLRSDIIWHKPNPMPESVTDRCTKSHEYIFLLAKSERYYFDQSAIAEKAVATANRGGNVRMQESGEGVVLGRATNPNGGLGTEWEPNGLRNRRSVWTVATRAYEGAHFAVFPPDLIEPCILAGCPEGGTVVDPFFGSGTTGQVAQELGRRCIGAELNPNYCELAKKRFRQRLLAV